MDNRKQSKQSDRLIFLGLILFLLGLIIGLFVQNMANPRMALSAHLEGIMNGMFLMVLGLIWKRLSLTPSKLNVAYGLAVYGTFANLLAVLIAAITGFGKMMPIAGGEQGTALLEGLISFLLVTLALCMIALCILVLAGFYGNLKNRDTH